MFKELNPLLHSELRLAVVSILIGVESADFVFIRQQTGATAGNLSVQLDKLAKAGYIEVEKTFRGKIPCTVCRITDAGRDALRRWVQHFPGQDQVVIKHPVILKTWLARGEDPERIVDTLERHLDATRARLDEALWSRRRSQELGITEDPEQRFSFAVLDYAIRGLYAEISNISQLRDEIAGGTSRDPVKRVRRSKGQIRRRAPRSPG